MAGVWGKEGRADSGEDCVGPVMSQNLESEGYPAYEGKPLVGLKQGKGIT